jgi:catechol 2,3-dioxygenase-like lactoylglutathione lyase family enzyme
LKSRGFARSVFNFALNYVQIKKEKMEHRAKSIRPFIGSKDFELSRQFYRDLGFQESVISHNMSYFKTEAFGFYLQDAYVRDWIDNSMIFLEVDNVSRHWDELLALDLTTKYKGVKLVPIRVNDWGRECFLHDPSGILWHFGEFYN